MDAELKAKWVSALRSGEFEQYRGTMMNRRCNTQLCCLGVLARVNNMDIANLRFNYEDFEKIIEGGEQGWRRLVRMNDDEGKTFSEIADYIEANL